MRECRTSGSVRGVPRNGHPYRNPSEYACKGRARAEQGVGKIRRFKRIALRCEKMAQNFAAFIALACTSMLVKSGPHDLV
jgi:hypothetical protein